MREYIRSFFDNENIEYYAVLDYEKQREINPSIAQRVGFKPKSIILFLLPYYVSRPENISIYSSSLDYHIEIQRVTDALSEHLRVRFPEASFRGFGDHSPINEVYAAASAGLGVIGDNGLIINEKYGSYVFIADLLTDIDPGLLGEDLPKEVRGCLSCGRCKAACPTGILSGCSEKCLSEITQRKGELSEDDLELMVKFNTVWGCDLCQTSCPYNRSPKVTPIEFFHKDRIVRLDSSYVGSIGKDEFKNRAFAWRGKAPLLRNLEYYERRTDSDNE